MLSPVNVEIENSVLTEMGVPKGGRRRQSRRRTRRQSRNRKSRRR
jgi:hypothetical protein